MGDNAFQRLLQQKMTRKEFLGVLGVGILVLTGIEGFIHHFLSQAATQTADSEAEAGTVTPTTAAIVNDTSASGSKAVKFGSGSSGSTGGIDLSTPSGYTPFYTVDWRNGDDGKWPFYSGSASNELATYRASNLSYVNGTGMVLTTADSGGTLYSARVLNSVTKCPQHFIARAYIKLENFGVGFWPSFWARPNSGQGEIDLMEGFGGHIGTSMLVFKGTLILTGSSTYNEGNVSRTYDTAIPQSKWNDLHCYEIHKTLNNVDWYIDGVKIGSVTQAQLDAVAKDGTSWATQFEGSGTWHWRADAQAGSVSGNTSAGTWPMGQGKVCKQTNVAFGIYVPSA